MIIFDGMTSELNILNKHLKKMFPFIIKVDSIALDEYVLIETNVLTLNIYVSPIHFVELSCEEVKKLINDYMVEKSTPLIKSVLPNWDGRHVKFDCTTQISKHSLTILNGLNLSL